MTDTTDSTHIETLPSETSNRKIASRNEHAGAAALANLRMWVESRDYAGYEPYDILNAQRLPGWMRKDAFAWFLIQISKRFPSNLLREWLRVPPSKNPKALGLFLAGYCDLARCGADTLHFAKYLKTELKRLRAAGLEYFCWGYDWDYVSLRGSSMRAFRPNSVASVFCGQGLLDMAEVFEDKEAEAMAFSVAESFVHQLNRPVNTAEHLCFSYTPENYTRVFNTSAMVGAFLARVGRLRQSDEYMLLARRVMQYLADGQHPDGSWSYGAGRQQKWVDNFHTGYNLNALLAYQRESDDTSFEDTLDRGYRFYSENMVTSAGIPKYFKDKIHPIDIHSCAQSVLVFCAFSCVRESALAEADRVLGWTLANMQSPNGSFYYQRHRLWVNRVPYMRWAQAWMFRALAAFLWRQAC